MVSLADKLSSSSLLNSSSLDSEKIIARLAYPCLKPQVVGRRCAAVRSVAVLWLPLCTAKLTLPWLGQRNCTLDAVDCSTNCAQSADSSRRSLQCNQCRCRMCDFCLAELGDPKRPRRPQTYHATLAHRTTSRSTAAAPPKAVCVRGMGDGFGSQLFSQMTTIAYCQTTRLCCYVQNAIESIDHPYNAVSSHPPGAATLHP